MYILWTVPCHITSKVSKGKAEFKKDTNEQQYINSEAPLVSSPQQYKIALKIFR
jgi:hypothetical protein